MSAEFATMKIKKGIYLKLVKLQLEKTLRLKSLPKITFNEVIQDLLDFYEKHKEEVS